MPHYKDIHLVPPSKKHLTYIVMMGNDGGVYTNHLSKRKTGMFEQQKMLQDHNKHSFVITVLEDKVIGLAELLNVNWVHRTAKLYMYFDDRANTVPSHGAKALKAMLKYCFENLNLNRIEVDVVVDDVVMSSLYKSVGFKSEVRKRNHHFKGGQFKTIQGMSMLSREWK